MKRDIALRAAKELLAEIEIVRDHPGPGKPSTVRTEMFCGKVAPGVIREFKKLPGAYSHNMERAMQLLIMVLKED